MGENVKLENNCTGVCKWFHDNKGYGFITLDDGRDVFVHVTGLADKQGKPPTEGQRVTLRLYKGDRGLFARSVVIVG